MKAVLCHAFGPISELVLDEHQLPAPGQYQVRIEVHGAGVNYPDVLMVKGLYQFKPPFPFAPGGEVAGIVTEVGEGVENLKVGDRVVTIIGWGGFAEEVVVDAAQVHPLPDSMDFVVGGGFILTYATAYYALKDRGRLKEGSSLLVLGAAGGVGLAAVQVGKALGATVIAATSSEEKNALCRAHGADFTINYQEEDLKKRVKELTSGNGVDVIFDPVGGDYAEPALRAIAWEGRYLVIGFAAGDIPKIPLNLTLLKGCEIVGVFWGSFVAREPAAFAEHIKELNALYSQGLIKPHIHGTYSLEEVREALAEVEERRVRGKIVIVPKRGES